MDKRLLLLAVLVVHLNGAFLKYAPPSKISEDVRHNIQDEGEHFDFNHLAHQLNEHEIFKPGLQDENRKPQLDLESFFEKLNKHYENAPAAKEDGSQISDSEYYPWKKEDVEKLTKLDFKDEGALSNAETDVLKDFLTKNPLEKAFEYASKSQEEECPVGTIYTYLMKDPIKQSYLKKCVTLDIKKIVIKLLKYKLTSPKESPPEFPTQTDNLLEAVATPVLDQPSSLVVLNSLLQGLQDFDIKNPLKLTWPLLWLGNAIRNQNLAGQYLAPGSAPNLTTYDGYANFLDEYRAKQKNRLFGVFPVKDFIHYPLAEDTNFEDITRSNKWQADDVFVQQRLAGLNPMSLRKLSMEDKAIFFLTKAKDSADWNKAMNKVAGHSFEEMVNRGVVFVLDYPLLRGIENGRNIEINDPDHRPLRKTVSPIAVFVSVPRKNEMTGRNENTLTSVGIKMDSRIDAPVFTPNDGDKWLMAKEEVQRADIVYVEIIEHLLKTHLLMEPICIIMRRTFSKLHPLYQLFSPHCNYLAVTNSVGVPALFDEHQFLYIIFSIGNTNSINLLNKGYKEMTWEDTNFEANLQKRGLMDNTTLPYFPYRDDGLLLWDKIGNFAEEYVKLYYPKKIKIGLSVKYGKWPEIDLVDGPASILTDIELQSFALQLASAKIGMIAGGKFKGFPKKITSQEQLIDIVKRIIFIPIQHSAINYPVSYYGAFVPNMPTKLYNPDTQDFSISNLPYYDISAYQLSIAMTLGSIRYDKYFDYGDDMKDERASHLVEKYHHDFHEVVNAQIFKRNCRRQLDGKFSYPYFMPQWLTNSIQT